MCSKALFKQDIRANYTLFGIIIAVMAIYGFMVAGMYDSAIQEKMQGLLEAFPPSVIEAFGFDFSGNTLIEFISSYLYGMLLLLLPMVFEIVVANRLLARYVDRGSMAYLLATPNRRRKIALTQALFLFAVVTLLLLLNTGILYLACEWTQPGQLEVAAFFKLNLGLWLLHLAVSGICFFTSALFNDTRYSLGWGAGFAIGFYLLQMLANMGGKLDKLKYATIFTLFDANAIVSGADGTFWPLFALGAIALVLYAGGCLVFAKRDLPL